MSSYEQEMLWVLIAVFKMVWEFEMVTIGIAVSAKWKKKVEGLKY